MMVKKTKKEKLADTYLQLLRDTARMLGLTETQTVYVATGFFWGNRKGRKKIAKIACRLIINRQDFKYCTWVESFCLDCLAGRVDDRVIRSCDYPEKAKGGG